MSNLTHGIAELRTLLSQCETEVQSLLAGKKASAPRVRASLQKIKTVSHTLRGNVMDHVKGLPTKTKGKKEVELPPNPPVLERQNAEEVKPKPKRVSKKTSKDKTIVT